MAVVRNCDVSGIKKPLPKHYGPILSLLNVGTYVVLAFIVMAELIFLKCLVFNNNFYYSSNKKNVRHKSIKCFCTCIQRFSNIVAIIKKTSKM